MRKNALTETYQQSIQLDESYFIDSDRQILDYSHLLRIILRICGQQDRYIQATEPYQLIPPTAAWVITQNLMQIHHELQLADWVRVETEAVHVNNFFICREIRLVKEASGDQCLTLWMQFASIDLASRQLTRIDYSYYQDQGLMDTMPTIRFPKMRALKNPQDRMEEAIQIQPDEIDGNDHVNNAVYLRWAFEALDPQFLARHELKEIRIKYGSELILADSVNLSSEYGQLADGSWQTYQQIDKLSQGKVACQIAMDWQ